jgi:hypothetical protein
MERMARALRSRGRPVAFTSRAAGVAVRQIKSRGPLGDGTGGTGQEPVRDAVLADAAFGVHASR